MRDEWTPLEIDSRLWARVFTIAPLVVVGTREPDGGFDLAPKHMAAPLGTGPYFGFVCTPRHRTYHNARRERAFTVSFPRPSQVVVASPTASPRCEDGDKGDLSALPVRPATAVAGVVLADAHLHLECELERLVDGFDGYSLVVGRVVAADARREALRGQDRDDQDVVRDAPLLAYLAPGRFARVERSRAFPFVRGFRS